MSEEEEKHIMNENGDDSDAADTESDSDAEMVDQEDHQNTMSDEQLDILEQKVAANPQHYEYHIEYINQLRKRFLFQRLRQAREKMSSIFPLSQDIWVEWIQDELRLATSQEEVDYVRSLFKRALDDYQSARVWALYCDFVVSINSAAELTKEAETEIRNTFEEAISQVGLNIKEGHFIWDEYRNWEEKHADSESPQQCERVRKLFQRQLSVPLLNIYNTWPEYSDWEENEDKIDEMEKVYEKTKCMVEERIPFEERIKEPPQAGQPSAEVLQGWFEYLQFEKDSDKSAQGISRVLCLYERAIAECCLVPELWADYVKFMEETIKSKQRILTVLGRSLRNCPWSGALWVSYITNMEKYGLPHAEIKDTYTRAFSAGMSKAEDFLNLCLAYCSYLRRKAFPQGAKESNQDFVAEFREEIEAAIVYLAQYFPDADPSCSLERLWANVEAKKLGNLDKARQLYKSLLRRFSSNINLWLEYINLEKQFAKDTMDVSKLCKQAIYALPYSQLVAQMAQQWMEFEREEGTLESYEDAQKASTTRIRDLQATEQKQYEQQQQQQADKKRKRADKQPEKKAEQTKKPRGEPKDAAEVPHEQPAPQAAEAGAVEATEAKFKKKKKAMEEKKALELRGPGNEQLTVFAWNLSFETNEEQLKHFFTAAGCNVKDARIIKNYKAQSKGYAYVEMNDEESVKKALALNQHELSGRKINITISKPKKQKGKKGESDVGQTSTTTPKDGTSSTNAKQQQQQQQAPSAAARPVVKMMAPRTARKAKQNPKMKMAAPNPAEATSTATSEANAPNDASATTTPAAKLSQNDFRAMLLKKK